ncbi:MAG: Lipoprotein signal peptidase [Ignavibacteriae bacterium]|nr:MAG: Lipoprotein signal peptidase [Ignavibacteriota bacterium]
MRILFVTFGIVILDQISKLLVKGFSLPAIGISVNGMQYGSSYSIIGDFLRLTYIENAGMAFGFDLGWKHLFGILSIVASILILYYLYKSKNSNLGFRLSLAMILGGAIGNLIDRIFYGVIFGYDKIFYGRVVDFIDVDFFNLNIFGYHIDRWPVFNFADASVTIGVILLLIFHKPSTKSESKNAI